MKILIVSDCYTFNMGGVTTSIRALQRGLRHYGHEVKTLALSNCNKSYREGEDYYIRSFPAFYAPDIRISFAKHDPLIHELEEWKPDIIHVQTESTALRFANAINKHCKVPMIMTCHTDYVYFLFGDKKNFPPIRALSSSIGHALYKKANRVVAPSEKAAKFSFLNRLKERINVVPNGIEIEKYQNRFSDQKRHKFRMSLGIAEHTKVLVFVSRLSKEKNIRELIAFLPKLQAKYNNVKLLIVGDGPDEKHLKKMTKRLKLQDSIIFTGRIPSDEVWKYYAAGDIYVSASSFEVHSMSYLEALSSGLPLLCRTDEALNGVLVHNENGFIYHSQNEFVDFAYKLLKNDELRKMMAKCSYKKSEDFSCDVFASSMINVYTDAINEKNNIDSKLKDGILDEQKDNY